MRVYLECDRGHGDFGSMIRPTLDASGYYDFFGGSSWDICDYCDPPQHRSDESAARGWFLAQHALKTIEVFESSDHVHEEVL